MRPLFTSAETSFIRFGLRFKQNPPHPGIPARRSMPSRRIDDQVEKGVDEDLPGPVYRYPCATNASLLDFDGSLKVGVATVAEVFRQDAQPGTG